LEQTTATSAKSGAPSTNKIVALVTASTPPFFAAIMLSALNVAVPAFNREFQPDESLLGWVATSYLLACGVFLIPFGRMADIIGIKKTFFLGTLIYTLASVVAPFSNSMVMLIVCRSIQGVGGAMVAGNSVAMVTAAFPLKERGRALGINLAAIYTGMSLGPFMGGVLTQNLGWRSIFWVNVVAGTLVLILMMWKVKEEWAASKGEKFDIAGSFIYGASLVALIYGFTLLPETSGIAFTTAGLVGVLAFFKYETRARSPVLDTAVFSNNRAFIFSNLAALINYSATYGTVFLLSMYLQFNKGMSPENAGLVLVAQPVVQAILSPFTGRLSDKLEPGIVASGGMALTFVGLLYFSTLGETTGLVQIEAASIVMGIGFALFSSPNTNAVMTSVAPKFYGVAAGTMNTMRTIGQMLSMGVTMIVMAVIMGKVVISPENHEALMTSIDIAFFIFTAICFAGIFASLYRGKVR
jgi:EmrB/QacA subfamily drug resistance transporter